MWTSIAVSPATPSLHDLLEKFAAEAESICAERQAFARNELAGQLNQAVRRIRQATTREDLGETVADAAAPFASGALWLRIENGAASSSKFEQPIPLDSAPALREASQSADPVVALAAPGEVSPALVERFAHTFDTRALIYPVLAKQKNSPDKAAALLYAWVDSDAEAQNAALELLSQVASAVWQALEPPPAPLIGIAPGAKLAKPWDELTPDEQRMHLRAQRAARVQVAEIRLRHAAEVQSGRLRRNLYVMLRDPIDAARESFRKEFFAQCPSMVDYLHLELSRTLANDDADLLGKDYPGPLV